MSMSKMPARTLDLAKSKKNCFPFAVRSFCGKKEKKKKAGKKTKDKLT